ncbi:hypothetical protein PBY51_009684 [Eleginops maclovinus]|uniref:Uncharacterized protein n=1 Tax=Eleginops maclovinus TaxID=56733 RepID=A0AAN8AV59_ELEMC|nr:hypothetical protein PBY51_009684 [Eleginops maclovinus]
MKPLLQPPTNHLVLWFCSDAFYKHGPGEHGEQVSYPQWQLQEPRPLRETLYLCLRNFPDHFVLLPVVRHSLSQILTEGWLGPCLCDPPHHLRLSHSTHFCL